MRAWFIDGYLRLQAFRVLGMDVVCADIREESEADMLVMVLSKSQERQWERGRNFAGFRPEGGESFQDVLDRTLPVFQEMSATAQEQNGPVLAVTHAGVIRVLLCHVLGMPLNNLFRLHLDWAGLSILEPAAGMWRVRRLNLRPGLEMESAEAECLHP